MPRERAARLTVSVGRKGGAVLNVARSVVDPRESDAVITESKPQPSVGRSDACLGRCRRLSEVELVDVDFVKRLVKILLRTTVKKLCLDLGFVDFGNGDAAELVEALVAYLTVEDNLLRCYVGTVDVAEDSLI